MKTLNNIHSIKLLGILYFLLSLTACNGVDKLLNEEISIDRELIINKRYDFSEVDSYIESEINDDDRINGMSYVVVNADGIVHQGTFGNHDNDTAVIIASATKMTTAVTMLAVDDDPNVSFSIEEPISTYVTTDGESEYAKPTVAQLISNTSGIPGLYDYGDYLFEKLGIDIENIENIEIKDIKNILSNIELPSPTDTADLLKETQFCQFLAKPLDQYEINTQFPAVNQFLNLMKAYYSLVTLSRPAYEFDSCAQQILNSKPYDLVPAGQRWRYGGAQWLLAGYAVSQAAGQSWHTLFDNYIAIPCELSRSTAYRNTFGDWLFNFDLDGFDRFSPDSASGYDNPYMGGGMITTLGDYAKILKMLLNGGYCGGKMILTQESIDNMKKDRGGLTDENATPYGLGGFLYKERPELLSSPGLYGSKVFFDTSLGIGAYISTDNYDMISATTQLTGKITTEVQNKIIEIVEKAQDSPKPVPLI